MSAKMQRYLRKKSDEKSTPFNTQKKPVVLGSAKKSKSYISTVADFDSETLSSSSPIKPHTKSDNKVYRKKIRTTQDFNQLSSSSTSPDSDISIKSEPRRAKKAKAIYTLPKITCVQEDLFRGKENKPPDVILNTNSSQKKSRGQTKNPYCEENNASFECRNHKVKEIKPGKRTRSLKIENEDIEMRNLTSNEVVSKETMKNGLKSKQDIHVKSSEEYQGAYSVTSDISKRDSEVEVKRKRKRKGYRRNGSVESETGSGDYYAKRIKKMLLNDCEVSNEEGTNSDGALNLKNSAKQSKLLNHSTRQRLSSNIRRRKSSANDLIQSSNFKDDENNGKKNSTCGNKMDEICNLRSVKNKKSFLASNELSWQRTSVGGTQIVKENVNRSSIRRTKSLFINSVVAIKDSEEMNDGRNEQSVLAIKSSDIYLKPSENGSYMSVIDDTVGSDDVFDAKESTARTSKVKQQASSRSVRFLSPEEKVNVKQNSSGISENGNLLKLADDKPLLQLIQDKCDIFEHSSPNSRSDSTFEINTPPVLNGPAIENSNTLKMIDSGINTSQNKLLFDNLRNKNDALNETFEINSPTQVVKSSKRRSKRSTVELPSPIYDISPTKYINELSPFSQGNFLNKTAVGSHVSPPENVTVKNKKATSEVSENSFLNGTFTVVDFTTPVVKTLRNSSGIILVETLPSEDDIQDSVPEKLSRQSTFTKIYHFEDEQNSLVNSNINRNYENVQTPPRAKLNRTATFTRGGCDEEYETTLQYDSPLVANISNMRNIDTSKVTRRRQWNKPRSSTSLLDSFVGIENISVPWTEETLNETSENLNASETFLESRHSSKRNVTIDESKNVIKVITKPGVRSTKIKMPNFALIHQRAYDKLESLKEMSDRKAARAKLLLSGCKPKNTPSKSKKCLQFAAAKSDGSSLNGSTKISDKGKKVMTNIPNVFITKVKNTSPSTSNPKVTSKENKLIPLEKKRQLLTTKSLIPKLKVPNKIEAEKKGFTRFGFKLVTREGKPATKEEQLKAVATRTNVLKNTVEERRNTVKGVRSNRRFELLMALRNK